MPTEAVLNRLSSRKVTESLMMQIILHCAPVLKDVKNVKYVYRSGGLPEICTLRISRYRDPGQMFCAREQDVQWYMYTGKQRCSSVWKIRRWLYFYSSTDMKVRRQKPV